MILLLLLILHQDLFVFDSIIFLVIAFILLLIYIYINACYAFCILYN